LTGNLSCSAGVTVDGVDISAHIHNGGSGGTVIPEITEVQEARENEASLLENLARRGADWVSNSVNSSSVDSDGFPNYISAGTGLAINGDGSSTPIKMDIDGYYQHIITNTSLTSLAASSTNYVYAEKS